jgi:hypothetical protein
MVAAVERAEALYCGERYGYDLTRNGRRRPAAAKGCRPGAGSSTHRSAPFPRYGKRVGSTMVHGLHS